jgi:MOSC domain-containing protein YiiM
MTSGKVLSLYMTMPDMIRSGHRMRVEDIECDENGIMGSRDYENGSEHTMVLVSKKSYDIIEEAELAFERGLLMEDIYVDVDLYHLKKGSVIEIGEMLFEVTGPCEDYRYLYAFAPELPELIQGKRGLFISPIEYGRIEVGDEVNVVQEA